MKEDSCKECKRVIPEQEPYVILVIQTGPRQGEKIPEKGMFCEPCAALVFAGMVEELRGEFIIGNVYH